MTSRILDVRVLAAAGIQLGTPRIIKLSIPPMRRYRFSFHSVTARRAPY
ncbi:hypothetical protein FB559_6572 [Actinoallomurus bryophytorum]|uniref:Uncharacterized protein n=1 Tax=Actinoallomurus bryophytorum TaxID=1490222 RepID=A0A543CUX7_9ACTN|nr:hypothetical protein [Actinoallomurus bryophytorum]TQM00849.1 hypothetical protein FB559_6572 [Actinoallomurus bryophytorum]